MASKEDMEDYGKVRVYRKEKKKVVIPEKERTHPVHTPYRRASKHSIVVDGLGEDFYDDED